MGSILRRSFICLLAISFVASGAAWRHCMAAQPALGSAAIAHQVYDAPTHHGMHHSEHAVDHQPVADHPDQPVTNDHTCGKCCSLCTFVGTPLPDMTVTVFTLSAVLFSCDRDDCSGMTVWVDPGIPKRLI